MQSPSRQSKKVRGQLHASATLLLEEGLPITTAQMGVQAPELVWTKWCIKESLNFCRIIYNYISCIYLMQVLFFKNYILLTSVPNFVRIFLKCTLTLVSLSPLLSLVCRNCWCTDFNSAPVQENNVLILLYISESITLPFIDVLTNMSFNPWYMHIQYIHRNLTWNVTTLYSSFVHIFVYLNSPQY